MAREFFCAYHSYLEAIEPLNDAERGRLFTACLAYSRDNELLPMPGPERYVFPSIKSQIDRDRQAYGEFCQKQSDKINKRWGKERNTAEYQGIPRYTKEKEMEKEKEKAMEKEKNKEERDAGAPSSGAGSLSQKEPPQSPSQPEEKPERKFVPPPPEVRAWLAQKRLELLRKTGVNVPLPPLPSPEQDAPGPAGRGPGRD